MKTYVIVNTASGEVVGSQTWADLQAPVLAGNQSAVPQTVGFAAVAGTFSGAGAGAALALLGDFNITVRGAFSASIQLERSFDSGGTWFPASFSDGSAVIFTAPASSEWTEVETGVLYRLNCVSFVSGAAIWRVSQ